eukprot:2844957-Prymnesium_polylepis.1
MVRRHSYEPRAAEDTCLDNHSSRLLLKKAWCHGQLVGAFQLVIFGYWTLGTDELPLGRRTVVAAIALMLPAWGRVSWIMIHSRTALGIKIMMFLGCV